MSYDKRKEHINMGNMTGAGLGMAIGALGGPIGMGIGAAIGGTVGMAAEVTNGTNVFKAWQGDRGHYIGYMSEQVKQMKVKKIYVMKTDICYTGFNTAASFGRAILAPMSTLAADNKSFWFEHWFVIFDVIGSGYLVANKSENGIKLYHVSSWEEALNKNGMTRRNVGEVKKFEHTTFSRSVQEIINRVKSSNSYYKVNGQNCQDFANQIYNWF